MKLALWVDVAKGSGDLLSPRLGLVGTFPLAHAKGSSHPQSGPMVEMTLDSESGSPETPFHPVCTDRTHSPGGCNLDKDILIRLH